MTEPSNSPDEIDPDDADGAGKKDKDPFDQGEINTRTDAFFDRIVEPVGWLVLVVAAISAYEIIARYVFNAPTNWVHESSTFLIAVVFVIGGVRALARNQHVQINLLQFVLPVRQRNALQVVNGFVLLTVCLALLFVSGEMAWDAANVRAGEPFTFERSGTNWNPPFPAGVKIALFVSCLFMSLQAAVQLRRKIRLSTLGKEQPSGSRGDGTDDGSV